MAQRADHNIWTGLTYDDPMAARTWLSALGFEEGVLVTGERAGAVRHSEMLWPEGGRVMVSSRGGPDDTFSVARGAASVYVVLDDPDAVFARAKQLGAEVVRDMEDTDSALAASASRTPKATAGASGPMPAATEGGCSASGSTARTA
ncbi:MAG: glyoxalase [Acidimicrobiales bacterium]